MQRSETGAEGLGSSQRSAGVEVWAAGAAEDRPVPCGRHAGATRAHREAVMRLR